MAGINKVRILMNRIIFHYVKKLTESIRFQEEIRMIVKDMFHNKGMINDIQYTTEIPEYRELGKTFEDQNTQKKKPIFITGRFRSGSTLIWNIFKHLDEYTAYYEPLLHEKPSMRGIERNFKTDPTHIGVRSYHEEYRSIPDLDGFHKSNWAFNRLYMGGSDFDFKLEEYIQKLIDSTSKIPVLQFNRVDFRLPWLIKAFPEARLIHIFRNPRDQWISMINNDTYVPKDYKFSDYFYPNINTFYLYDWWRDLKFELPILEIQNLSHPYQIHFLLWRISYMYGKRYCPISICFEELLMDTENLLLALFKYVGADPSQLSRIKKLVDGNDKKGKWEYYADDEWFKRLEMQSENLLFSFFNNHRNLRSQGVG
jgi:hypothetical protein